MGLKFLKTVPLSEMGLVQKVLVLLRDCIWLSWWHSLPDDVPVFFPRRESNI